MENTILKIAPYGMSDFQLLRENELAYVDKTQFIELLETQNIFFSLIVRPRRFGKTLFTQILKAYYDIAAAKDFEKNFAGTYIGNHKTAQANTYHVIRFEFSGFTSSNFKSVFLKKVRRGLVDFCQRYSFKEGDALLDQQYDDPTELAIDFFALYRKHFREKIYLIVDEYDQSTSEILAKDVEAFRDLTKADGLLKSFYSCLKDEGSGGVIKKIFITGVTSIQLDSMTSGFSIAKNLSVRPQFASMFGFTEAELRALIPQLVDLKSLGKTENQVFSHMKEFYNGYRFSPQADVSVFNSSMCLYFLDYLHESGEEPIELMDPSVSTDVSKIHGILRLGKKDEVLEIVRAAMAKEEIPFSGVPEVLNLQDGLELNRNKVLSILFYMGFLTFAPKSTALVVPNRTIAKQFFDVYFAYIRGIKSWSVTESLSFNDGIAALHEGNARVLLEKVSEIITRDFGKNASLHLKESDFQVALLMAANIASGYEYFTELEVRGVRDVGFADLFMVPTRKDVGPAYLFELKYLPKTRATKVACQKALTAAKKQLAKYAEGKNIKTTATLKRIAVVFAGTKIAAFSEEES